MGYTSIFCGHKPKPDLGGHRPISSSYHQCPGIRQALAEAYTFMELYAGEAWVSHCMRAGGHPTASLDILFGSAENGKQNCFDLLSDSGFLLLNMKLVS